jgi:drug/metabolite transporter (DMT)-like permease
VLIALPLAVLNGETLPLASDIGWSVVSGLLGVVGLGCLYHGLGVGRMGVVAPVTGVLVAIIPVTTGIVLEGAPPGLALAGIALAIASVAVVARVPGETADRTSGFWWGIGAGLTLGAFTVTISRVTHGLVFGPLAIVRFTETLACVAVILVTRRAWRPPRSAWPAFLGIGAIDMIGTAAYLAAAQVGPLAIAAVLSALYPAVTVIFAATILREPMTRLHLIGVVGAAIAVVLIAGGQSG